MSLEHKVEKLVEDVSGIKTDLALVKAETTNHIPSQLTAMSARIASVDKRVWWIVTFVISTLVAVIFSIVR